MSTGLRASRTISEAYCCNHLWLRVAADLPLAAISSESVTYCASQCSIAASKGVSHRWRQNWMARP